jgi:hypothetical protein
VPLQARTDHAANGSRAGLTGTLLARYRGKREWISGVSG